MNGPPLGRYTKLLILELASSLVSFKTSSGTQTSTSNPILPWFLQLLFEELVFSFVVAAVRNGWPGDGRVRNAGVFPLGCPGIEIK